jgi:hypothetical protein
VDTYKKIMHLVFEYCLSENYLYCERKKLKQKGEFIPNAILQGGKFIKAADFLEEIIH